ncbi:MAG: hypothetical protein RLY20_3017 [Verrucomicrobiota bacterium]
MVELLGSLGGDLRLARGTLAFQVGFTTTTFLDLVALLSHINLYKRGLFRLCGATMNIATRRFNLYLLALLGAAFITACASSKKEKQPETSLRVHTEATSTTAFTKKVSLLEQSPIDLVVDQSPLLSDLDVDSASVVNSLGGYAIVIKFNKRGQWLLDEHSSLNIGRHLVVFVQYGEKPAKAKWIAAPIISNRISDGALIFTPDVSREDAEAIVKGLGIKKGLDKPAKD